MVDDILDIKKKMKTIEKKTFIKAIKSMPQLEGYIKTQITRGGEKLLGNQGGGFYLNNCYFKWEHLNPADLKLINSNDDEPCNLTNIISDDEEECENENENETDSD